MQNQAWKYVALQKQLQFKQAMGLSQSGTHAGKVYPHILHPIDAANAANFYCCKNIQEWQQLQQWAHQSKGKPINFEGEGLSNLLRSEHIPFNIFYPLEKLRVQHPKVLQQLLIQLLQHKVNITEVVRIKIEFASDIHKNKLLDDSTSFDAYIEYNDGNNTCGIGIEVKYTEKSYPFGFTEKQRIDNPNSTYNTLSKKYYHPDTLTHLHSKKLKQQWRNHLLGFKLVEIGLLHQFHSVLLYPSGNTYQANVCNNYKQCLKEEFSDKFMGITFEEFISAANNCIPNNIDKYWIDYFSNRY